MQATGSTHWIAPRQATNWAWTRFFGSIMTTPEWLEGELSDDDETDVVVVASGDGVDVDG